jgi:hypothetical protein
MRLDQKTALGAQPFGGRGNREQVADTDLNGWMNVQLGLLNCDETVVARHESDNDRNQLRQTDTDVARPNERSGPYVSKAHFLLDRVLFVQLLKVGQVLIADAALENDINRTWRRNPAIASSFQPIAAIQTLPVEEPEVDLVDEFLSSSTVEKVPCGQTASPSRFIRRKLRDIVSGGDLAQRPYINHTRKVIPDDARRTEHEFAQQSAESIRAGCMPFELGLPDFWITQLERQFPIEIRKSANQRLYAYTCVNGCQRGVRLLDCNLAREFADQRLDWRRARAVILQRISVVLSPFGKQRMSEIELGEKCPSLSWNRRDRRDAIVVEARFPACNVWRQELTAPAQLDLQTNLSNKTSRIIIHALRKISNIETAEVPTDRIGTLVINWQVLERIVVRGDIEFNFDPNRLREIVFVDYGLEAT